MARKSFRLRRATGAGDTVGVGSYVRGLPSDQESVGVVTTDQDAALKSSGVILVNATSDASVFEASPFAYNGVTLRWLLTEDFTPVEQVGASETKLVEVAVVYSTTGYPETVVDGTLLIQGTVTEYNHQTQLVIQTESGSYIKEEPEPGKWAYYTLFAYYNVDGVGGSYFYEKLESLEVLMPYDHGSVERLWKRVPQYYRELDANNSAIDPENLNRGQLQRFLDVFGFEIDKTRSLIDSLMVQYDPLLAEANGVAELANMLGLELNVNDIGVSRTRALLHDIGYIRRQKGTIDATKAYITAVSGSDVTITTGASAPFYTFNVHAQRANLVADPRFLTNSGVSWNVAQQPAVTRTNLIPNPNFEVNTAGWGSANATITRSTAWSAVGTASLLVTPSSTNADSYGELNTTATALGVQGLTCTFSATINVPIAQTGTLDGTDARSVQVFYQRASTGGTYYSAASSQGATTGATRLSVTVTFPSDTTQVLLRLNNGATNSASNIVYFDAVMLEIGSSLLPYFDGTYVNDYQGYGILSKGWSGTANASTSTASWFTGNTRTNLVPNPNFEVDTTGWAGLGGATLSRSTASAFIGTASMLITDPSTGSAGASTTFTPVSGASYTFSFYVKNIAGLTRNMYAQIGWTGGTFSTSSIISVPIGMNNWLRISVTGTAPNSSTANLYIVTSDSGNTETTETALVDGILLETGSALLPYFDGAFTAKRQNLIPNPSFETNTTGWNANGSTNTRVAGTWGTGSWVYQIVATGTGLSGTFSDFASFPVTEGQPYTASCSVRSVSGTLRQVQIGLNWYNGAGTSISASTSTSTLTTSSQRISVTGTAPVGAVHALVSVYGLGTGTVGDTWQLDSVLVEAGSALRSYFDGTSTEQDYNGFTLNTQAWAGTANASTSTTSWYTTNLLPTISTTPTEGIQITAGASGNKIAVVSNVAVPVSANNAYYISADFSSLPQIVYGGSWATSSTWTDWSDNTAAASISVGVDGRYAYEMNPTTSGTKYPAFLLNLSAGQSITLSKWMVEPNGAGQFFDGDTVFSGFLYQGFTSDHTWSGTPYASYSLYTTNRKKTQDALSRLMPKILPVTLMGTSGGNAKYLMQFDWIPGKT